MSRRSRDHRRPVLGRSGFHHLFRGGELRSTQPLSVGEGGWLIQSVLPAHEPHARMPTIHRAQPAASHSAAGKEVSEYRRALVSARYNVAEAARRLGLMRAQMAYRLKRHGLI